MRPLAVALLAVAVGACGSEPEGVTVTEAEPDGSYAPPTPRRGLAFDTVYADDGLFDDPEIDSLAADSLRADSLADASSRPAAPDFRQFWPEFQRAIREGEPAVTRLSDADAGAALDSLYVPAFEGLFREGVLDLTARSFRRQGSAREVSVVVGFDARGRVVPEDEAVREASLVLRFDVVDGAYRLVRLAVVE